jgi:poly-gamma-glutamate synthesis protein (capsule biosynthesis protein)
MDPAPPSPPSGTRRLLRGLGITVGAGVALILVWALFWTLYNPRVPLAAPLHVSRSARGEVVTVLLGGDTAPQHDAMPGIRAHGYGWPYRPTAGLFRAADVTFLNVEAPVTDTADALPRYTRYRHRVRPAAAAAWAELGLTVAGLANNHLVDRATTGLLDTVRHLEAAGIAPVGCGANEAAARRPVIVDVGGTRIGFLAYLEDGLFNNLWLRIFAVGRRPGCARLLRSDVTEDVRRLRPQVDVLVVSVHWGRNYTPLTASQKRLGRWISDLGVDVVAGHGPHHAYGVERRGRRVILYSLGNYALGAFGSPALRVGLLARLEVRSRRGDAPGRLSGVELIPLATQNRIVGFQPRPLGSGELGWVTPLLEESRGHATPVEVVGTRLRIPLPP